MGELEIILDHLEEVFRDQETRLNGKSGSLLHALQKKSFEDLKQVRFPDRKHEDWKYTAVQRLISPKYKLAFDTPASPVPTIPGLEAYSIPVVNGKVKLEEISPELLSTGVTITLLQDAMESPAWNEAFGLFIPSAAPSSNRAFELLNFAFTGHGCVIRIPKGKILDKPIEIRFTHQDPELSFSNPLYFIHAGAGSQCTIMERFEKSQPESGQAPSGLINALGFIRLDPNAAIQHIKWQDLPASQNLVYKLKVAQMRDSRFITLGFDHGGAMIRNNIDVELEESNTYTSLQAGFLAKGTQSMDHQTRINHKVPYGESHELYKGIIDQQASAAFNGKVYVHPDAQKTNAFQQNDTLVLSPNAVMNSKPQLEIFADDVRCSHGATIGQLDDKALFYLQSRGIHPDDARHMLKTAFLTTVFDAITIEPVRDYIQGKMVSQI